MTDPCRVDGCDWPTETAGYCQAHYARTRKTGSPGSPVVRRFYGRTAPPICEVEGCGRRRVALGLCNMHRKRLEALGDVGPAESMRALWGQGTIVRGYRKLSIKGQLVFEHRLVMERLLGRPLWPDETVHHKNGDRLDNRPENLELWSKGQPSGQRVDDKIAWAIELLERYNYEVRCPTGAVD